MNDKGIKLLKTLSAFIVMCSSFLYVMITPSIENATSLLKTFNGYNSIPYNEEVAVNLDNTPSYNVVGTYIGTVTAYGPDCSGCTGTTSSGYKVITNGTVKTTYNDEEYGEVRILAADPKAFPYGTIIKIMGERIDGYILGIVLDTGGAMKNEWAKGNVLIDLLFESEKNSDVYDFGRQKNVTFEVLRYGK